MNRFYRYISISLLTLVFVNCKNEQDQNIHLDKKITKAEIEISFSEKEVELGEGEFYELELDIPASGRYQISAAVQGANESSILWVEDYVNNKDDRTYNITGDLKFNPDKIQASIDGSPLRKGKHEMRIHCAKGSFELVNLKLNLIKPHKETPEVLTQNMTGNDWRLVWSDEFNGTGLPDSTKWSYNIGNWGWGNNEIQYYTELEAESAHLEDGNLIIEARKEDGNWTSARLTTQEKTSFLYGKIEFKAKVPSGRGTWAAGWLLGEEYIDELSWPYCGEIDVLECVGFEIEDSTGDGLNHATCHTRSYYFKQGNQIGSEIEVKDMKDSFHVYSIEWYPNEIRAYLDGEHYYTYDKNANELEWPFNKPQNLIINLAIGGGWGGAKGVDENLVSQKYILDYVRIYEAIISSQE